jgi:hypothetical protein
MVAKKDLKIIPWERTGVRLANGGRTMKMIQPVCPQSAVGSGCEMLHSDTAWWVECEKKGHNPYYQVSEEKTQVPIVAETEDGRKLITGYEEEIELVESIRTNQVVFNNRVDSKQGVELKRFLHGWKHPEEMGFAPMCEFRNCFAPNPEIKTRYGNFCSEDEARIVIADERHVVLEVMIPEKRRDQLEGIVIR